jgi:lipopolysaccharide transport system ATP-binding protein
MSNTAIIVKNLAKQYTIGLSKRSHDTLRDHLMEVVRAPFHRNGASNKASTLWALNNISFEIPHGEAIGIIGSNGAGKSTLLKILSRITAPTKGFAEIHGRLGSLLEVGTGFHPELTGRENIFLNGAILGMKKAEIQRQFDEIVAFSEVEKFLDTPVKRYSSGMQIRLAFAVAAHLEPEVLLVDEVLAVGDVTFQKKCLGKMERVAREGRTVLFVSHNLAAVQHLCHRGIVLRKGEQVFQGSSRDAVDYYLNTVAVRTGSSDTHVFDLTEADSRPSKFRPLMTRLELFTDGDRPITGGVKMGGALKARISVRLEEEIPNLEIAVGFNTLLGERVFTAHTAFQRTRVTDRVLGNQTFVCEIPSLTFTPGEYKILLALGVGGITTIDLIEDAARIDVVGSDYYGTGKVPWNGLIVLEHRWYRD